jgi:hypothetical protein
MGTRLVAGDSNLERGTEGQSYHLHRPVGLACPSSALVSQVYNSRTHPNDGFMMVTHRYAAPLVKNLTIISFMWGSPHIAAVWGVVKLIGATEKMRDDYIIGVIKREGIKHI